MNFTGFLAMTGAEIALFPAPVKLAYMSCHFSPFGTGLSCIPKQLPEGSLLMLTDRTPVCGHDPLRVRAEVEEAVTRLNCAGVVLDLQRTSEESRHIVTEVLKLPCPVIVSELYAEHHDCAVLVAAPPLWTPLPEALRQWQGREVWLEAVTDAAVVTVTEAGSKYERCPPFEQELQTADESLHILYDAAFFPDHARYRLQRDSHQLLQWMDEAKQLNVRNFLGLYQQNLP